MVFKIGNKTWKKRANNTGDSWNKGLTKEIDERMMFISKKMLGEKNPMWKGNNIQSKSSLHTWIKKRKLKPKFCENCKRKLSYDLANISGKYKRDINDYKWLCRTCHMKEDGRIFNLNGREIINEKTKEKYKIAKVLKEKGLSYDEIANEMGYFDRGGAWYLLNKFKPA